MCCGLKKRKRKTSTAARPPVAEVTLEEVPSLLRELPSLYYMSSKIKVVTNEAELSALLYNAEAKLVVLYFYASWCGACRRAAPVVESLAADHPDVLFYKCNVDQSQRSLIRQYGVRQLPTFVICRNSEVISTVVGNLEKLKEIVKNNGDTISIHGQSSGPDQIKKLSRKPDVNKPEHIFTPEVRKSKSLVPRRTKSFENRLSLKPNKPLVTIPAPNLVRNRLSAPVKLPDIGTQTEKH